MLAVFAADHAWGYREGHRDGWAHGYAGGAYWDLQFCSMGYGHGYRAGENAGRMDAFAFHVSTMPQTVPGTFGPGGRDGPGVD